MKIIFALAILFSMPAMAADMPKKEADKCLASEKPGYKYVGAAEAEFFLNCFANGFYPQDVRRFVSDAEECVHFSGEINGDGSEGDKHAIKIMNDVCLKHDAKQKLVEKLITKYKTSPFLVNGVKEAAESYSMSGN